MARPVGVRNGEGEKPLAPVKKWTMRHEMILYYHVHNYSGEEIAELVRCTPGRVSQVLNDPYAKSRLVELRQRLKSSLMSNLENRLANLGENALQRIEHTINRVDIDLVLHPDMKKHQDRLSFDVLTRLGLMGRPEELSGQDGRSGQPNLTESLMKKLTYALEKSNEAEELRRKVEEGKVVEGEVEIEQEDEKSEEAGVLS